VQLLQEIIRLNNIQNAIGGSISNINNIANHLASGSNVNASTNQNNSNNQDVNSSNSNSALNGSDSLDPGNINTESNIPNS
jgi:hypothetical protein